jgi:hypothetical protein
MGVQVLESPTMEEANKATQIDVLEEKEVMLEDG